MGYFHIPDGCYFNYTELLDFVLWIYMFFLLPWMRRGILGKGNSVVLNLLFIEAPCLWQTWGKHTKLHCL